MEHEKGKTKNPDTNKLWNQNFRQIFETVSNVAG